MEEVEALKHVLTLFERWQHLSTALLQGHRAGLAAVSEASLRGDDGHTDAGGRREATHSAVTANELASESSGDQLQPQGEALKGFQPVNGSSTMPLPQGETAGMEGRAQEALEASSVQHKSQEQLLREPQDDATVAPKPAPKIYPGEPRMLLVKTLSQLAKSALSLELAAEDLQADMLGALKQQYWRQKADAALRPNSKLTGTPNLELSHTRSHRETSLQGTCRMCVPCW